MKPKRLPIKVAKDIAKQYEQRQVIVVTWDGYVTHVVTYGKSLKECDQAATGGDRVKEALNWPAYLVGIEPSRVSKLRARIQELEHKLKQYTA